MSLPQKTKFDPTFPIADGAGRSTQFYRDYLARLDLLIAAMAAGNLPTLVNAANDAAAAAAGVLVGQMYRNGSILMVRVV